jgi:hypothetical protein
MTTQERSVQVASGCREWRGAKHRQGYGQLRVGGRVQLAHRVAWEEAHGPIADGLHVCHRCDNPSCVNIDHLFLGTHLENMRDRQSKGRTRLPPKATGSQCAWAKLGDHDVVLIRLLVDLGVKQPKVAALFGVSQTMVSGIHLRKTWKHVAPLEGWS